jgi:hypothetical protein
MVGGPRHQEVAFLGHGCPEVQILIPTSLEQWNAQVIIELFRQGVYESEFFDFKGTLPHKNDASEKERLRLTCCAFANSSSGGFLVFGVKDASAGTAEDRLVGLAPSLDFPEHFGNHPAACEPSVLWTFKNPPVQLATGNVVHVVHIPHSWNAPHCLDVGREAKRFPKRTHKGTEEMSYEEIRLMFLQYYEKRLKLQLLRAELETIKAESYALAVSDNELGTKEPPRGEYSLAVLEGVLADTYSILAQQTLLLDMLTSVRRLCRQVNEEIHRWAPFAYAQLMNKANLAVAHNRYINTQGIHIRQCCDKALRELDNLLKNA